MKKIKFEGRYYSVVNIQYKGHNLPMVMDYDDYKIIKLLNKKWYLSDKSYVITKYNIGNKKINVKLHDLIMGLKQGSDNIKYNITHTNRIGLDNRSENIIYMNKENKIKRNKIKKKRTIKLPKNCKIKIEEIPTYIWYMKPNNYHGERFMISLPNGYTWKTTSRKNIKLKTKLDMAKQHLLEYKKVYPKEFAKFSMNGDYNECGIKLAKSYYEIVNKAGYTNIKYNIKDKTKRILGK